MKSLTIRFSVAVVILSIVICAALWMRSPSESTNSPEGERIKQSAEPQLEQPSTDQPEESPEAKAVRLAEAFIAQNGYTDLPPDSNSLVYETIEYADNIDELLRWRHDTLERKAYGILRESKNAPGWTIVFRYKHPDSQQMRRNGRAVTMNVDGSKMRVEHKDFILKYVDKKL